METDRLSEIATLWSVIGRAHQGPGEKATMAQRQLLERYGGAIRRYLLGALGDPDAADELYQVFAYRFLHGDLRGADPNRGRFRDFVKGVLFHLIADHHKRARHKPLPADHPDLVVETPSVVDADREFLAGWRDDLLAQAWSALAEFERRTAQPLHTVLRFRADHPDMRSPQMAGGLAVILKKPLTATAVRQMLHRARDKFADLLLAEVARSLENSGKEALVQELVDLKLLDYCRPALQRRFPQECLDE